MPGWLSETLSHILTIILTLSTTLIFNKLVGVPKEIQKQKEIAKQQEEKIKQDNCARDAKIAALESTVNALPVVQLYL